MTDKTSKLFRFSDFSKQAVRYREKEKDKHERVVKNDRNEKKKVPFYIAHQHGNFIQNFLCLYKHVDLNLNANLAIHKYPTSKLTS